MRRISNKLSMLVLALVFSALVITPNTQAQSVSRSLQSPNVATYKAFAGTLTAEQFTTIGKILEKYKAELETSLGETAGQPNAFTAKSVFLPLVQGGNSSQSSVFGAPTFKRDFAVEQQAKLLREVQQQINQEIRSILTEEQAALFDAVVGAQGLPEESDFVQSANADINTSACYDAYYYGWYAEYYAYYGYYWAYWAWYYADSTYAWYAHYDAVYAAYYSGLQNYYAFWCFHG